MKTKETKIRESGIELLRIICMLQVIFLHVTTYGKYSSMAGKVGPKHLFLFRFIWLMCRGPVFIFIIMLGYFLVSKNLDNKSIKPKISIVHKAMLFYAISLPIIMWLFGRYELNVNRFISMFLPFLHRTWYFLTLYILVIIFSPYLNKLLQQLTKQEYMQLILLLTFIFCIWQPLSHLPFLSKIISVNKIVSTSGGKSLYDFIFMYILGGYLRLHYKSPFKKNWHNLIAFVGLDMINLVLMYTVTGYKDVVSYNDNLFSVLQCIVLFTFFKNLTFKSKTINLMSSLNLGVYMIHEHPAIREYIWNDLFKSLHSRGFYSRWYYPIKILLICIFIFVICSLIEFGRTKLTAFVSNQCLKHKQKKTAN